MYLKDSDVYIKVQDGYERVTPALDADGNLRLIRSDSPIILKSRPVGAKPVVSCEVIAQLSSMLAQGNSAAKSGGVPEQSGMTNASAQHTAAKMAQNSSSKSQK